MAEVVEFFTLADIKFKSQPLDCVSALKGLDILSDKLLPAIVPIFEGGPDLNEAKVFTEIGKAAAALPELFEIFAEHGQWQHTSGAWLSVKTSGHVFARRPTLLLAWLSHCLRLEYSDFLSSDGRDLIGATGNAWISLFQSIGESGGS